MHRLFLALLSVIICHVMTLAQTLWDLKAESAKVAYMVGEPIDIGISYTNKSTETVHLDPHFASGGILINERGEQIPCKVLGVRHFAPRETLFVGGQEDYHLVNLNLLYGVRLIISSEQSELPIGSYCLKIWFRPTRGRIQSDSMFFHVVPPSGEEAMIYDRFKQLLVRAQQEGPSRRLQNALEFRNLAENHPASAYAPGILNRAETYYRISLNDQVTSDELSAKIVEDYPGSSVAEGHMLALLRNARSKAERVTLLDRCRAKVPENAPMRKVIEQRLRKELNR